MSTLLRRKLIAFAVAMAATTSGIAVLLPATPAQAAFTSTVGGTITRSEVIERAQYWVDHQPGPYDQQAYSPDPTHSRNYRRDCSGYVDMAWHTNADYYTGNLATVSTAISRTALQPGDILNYAIDHVLLFHAWEADHIHFSYYSFGSTPVKHTSHASINQATFDGHANSLYEARRYNKISNGSGGHDTVAWATRVAGGLQIHATDGPYAGGAMIDSTPNSDEYLIAGDWNGDGSDSVAWVTRQSGGLQIHGADGPYSGGVMIDSTPNSDEVLIAGDWNGDGKDTVAWVTRQGGLSFHPADGPNAGGAMIDSTPNSDEVLIAGDWNSDGSDSVAWVTRQSGGLQIHGADGPYSGGLMIDSTPTSDEYLLPGDWDGI